MIYLDYAATTPVDPKVATEMQTCLTLDGNFANPASKTHAFGINAVQRVEQARADIANMLNAEPREIIFTSGATESDNLAIKGLAEFHAKNGQHIIPSMTEHKAVLDSCLALEKKGFEVTYLRPEKDGRITLSTLEDAIRPDTILISIMQVNNETGVIQDIEAMAKLAKQHGIYFHTDAAQGFAKIPLDVQQIPVDLISIASHKIYGPKGIGALYVRRKPRVRLVEQISGGKHEQGLRSGTLPTHQIVGLAEAAKLMQAHAPQEQEYIANLRTLFLEQFSDVTGVQINEAAEYTLPNILNVTFEQVDNEALMAGCPELAFSAGSACTSAAITPSHVLAAMGLNNSEANNTIRISFGRFTSEQDILTAAKMIKQEVARIRAMSPLWQA